MSTDISTDTIGADLVMKISDTLEGLATAPAITNVLSHEEDPGKNFTHTPYGQGFGLGQRVVQTLDTPKGSVTRKYDAKKVKANDIFWNAVHQSGDVVHANFVQIQDQVTRRMWIVVGAKGNCPRNAPSPEGFVTETWTYLAESIYEFAY